MINPLLRSGTTLGIFLLLALIPMAMAAQGCPSAGESSSTTVCSTVSPIQLLNYLGGNPDGGGTWQAPGGAVHGHTYDPAIHPEGVYTYTIPAGPGCPALSATLQVSRQLPPDAGTSASTTVCSVQPAFNMRLALGGPPPQGGTWTGPDGQPHVSSFDPASDPPGMYTYRVSGLGICDDGVSILTVTKITSPNAGTNGTLAVCSSGPVVQLINSLGGDPDPGGTWTGPAGAHSGSFDPATHPAGVYTYTVTGTDPCPNASATVTVTINQQPVAGGNGTHTVCSNGATFNLIGHLTGSPQTGGAWTGPGGGAVSGTYTPGTSVPGTYTYTVLGDPPCNSASATVQVTQAAAPDAGSSASITVCSSDAAFALISRLNGSPSPGGAWTGPDGPHGASFNPAIHPGGIYTYTVAGTAPCANATTTLSITVRTAPNAGLSASTTVCSTDGSFALFNSLGGPPQPGGTWVGPDGLAHSGTFTPGTSAAGAYNYTVTGQSPCTPAMATVTVAVSTAPHAGTGGSVVRCSNDASFTLISQLSGTPDAGGSWSGPGGAHSGTFNPAVDPAGAYTYTVNGQAPCASATAVLNISVVPAANAGTNGSTTVCSNATQFLLLSHLGGTPSASGTWTAPGGGGSNGTFVPGTSTPGVYTYTVIGQSPCANAQATVTVSVQARPEPGTNGSITICSDAASLPLFPLLGGTPATGGTWTLPGGGAHNGTYLPSSQPGGNYTYTVQGTAPCLNASAIVQVNRVIAPRAGTDGTITLCSTSGPYQMINALGGSPEGNGTWRDATFQTVTGTFTPGTTAPGTYAYVVPGTAPCSNDTSLVTVNVEQAPVAGGNASLTVCSSMPPFELITALAGSPDAGGTWVGPDGQSHNGTFTPGTSVAGGHTYTVTGAAPCLNASAVVSVSQNRQPVAGTSTSFTRCSTDAAIDLMSILGGTPDAGGVWAGPGPLTGSVFTPGTSAPGMYTYTVPGTAPCQNATATVTAVVNVAPNAGADGTLTVCQDAVAVDLRTGLSGTPDLNGSWTDDNGTGQLSGNLFSANGLALGTYSFTYTVPGIDQCASDQAVVQVTIVGVLNAGSNGLMNVCRTNTQVNLFNGLNGSPQAGGTWIDVDATGAQTGQFFNASFVPPGSYLFRYQLGGTTACATSSADVTVNVTAAPNAGTNGQAVLCSNGAAVPLIGYLGGSPSAGGSWTRGGQLVPALYDPVGHSPGTFIYTVGGTGPCPDAQASVVVSEVAAPVAGSGGAHAFCCSDGAVNMTQLLTGSPEPGSWTFNGGAHGPLFVPCLDAPGVYVYSVPGQAPCNASTTSLTISVVDPPFAGSNGTMQVCSADPPFVLLGQLAGAQFGGVWTAPDENTHTATHLYDPGISLPGEYIYTVTGTPPCPADEASLMIFENSAARAGGDIAVSYCSNDPSVDLFTLIPGDPDPSGTWVAPGGGTFNGTFVPGTSAPGSYLYIVDGAAPCEPDTSTVTVTVDPAPNAGENAVKIVCSNNEAFSMIQQLGGSPQMGGSWTGPLPATTTMEGLFFPGTTPPGTYQYSVGGNGACPAATATLEVIVNPRPFAGNNLNLPLCSTSGVVQLFPLLGPNAQPGGVWGPPGFTGTFDPAVHTSGPYTYTVTGLPPCGTHTATVSVVLNQAPNAGFNGLITICDNALPFDLTTILNGNPQLTGSWVDPEGQAHSGIFIPGSDQGGVYTYTVNGTPPCTNATAQVTVIQHQAPHAGGDGVVQVCSNDPPFQLIDHLTGTPDPGGDWTGPQGPSSGTFIPGTSQPGIYTYVLTALEPCTNDTLRVTVIQYLAPDAGCNAAVQICSSAAPFPLIDLLGCTPQPNGFWTLGANGPPHGTMFDPATGASGTYVYTIPGSQHCPSATAQVQITRVVAPYAGADGAVAACVNDASINLFNALGGSPTMGGTWTAPPNGGTLSPGGLLNATGVAPGIYSFRYRVTGSGPCPADTAFVTVQISTALDAGDDAVVEVCESQLFPLFNGLGGTPQAGGTWTGLDNCGALIGNVFNASQVPPGTICRYDYILPASSQCEGDTARVTVVVVDGPFAGCNGQVNVCSTSPPVALGNSLGCAPDADGSWFAPGHIPHSGNFNPAEHAAGVYWYVVPAVGNCPADSSSVTVGIQPGANAGQDTQVSICSTDPSIDLFPLLGPDAQPGGTWDNVTLGIPFSGVYNPATHQPGMFRYTVQAQLPCANAFALVEVLEPAAPNAGCNASVNVCSSQPPIQMLTYLGCGPQSGGTWTGPDGPHTGQLFNPAVHTPGPYQYVLPGVAPCPDASATLFIAVTTASNAGTSTTVHACVTQDSVDLFEALGILAEPGGSITDLNNSGALSGMNFDPSEAGIGTWNFQYAFPANGPCPAISSTIAVIVSTGSDPGSDSSLVVCGLETAFDLFTVLGGTPDPGGSWLDPAGTGALLDGGLLNVQLLPPGTTAQFGYQIADPGCGTVSSVVTITASEYSNPGLDATIDLCATSAPVDLITVLGGNPDPGGIWLGSAGAVHGGTFTPGVDPAGTYRYTMPATDFCPPAEAQVIVQVDPLPNAGADGTIISCGDQEAMELFQGLAGQPQTGGTWTALQDVGDALSEGTLNTTALATGSYQFNYTVTNSGCGSAEAVVTVQVIESVEVANVAGVCRPEDRTYVVSFTLSGGDPATYAVDGLPGSISAAPPYIFTSVNIPSSLSYEFIVQDGSGCSSIVLTGVSPCTFDDAIFIPQSFSPNDDGINDEFVIPGIEGFQGNSVVIFNRWGNKVFEASGYDNHTVVWDGNSDGAVFQGKAPAGTYYYVIELGDGSSAHTGYIYLNR